MKMYYYYGVMGSSKTANALMKKFNFEEHGKKVALMKPSVDNRDGKTTVKSRIGLSSEAILIERNNSIRELLNGVDGLDVIIVDEAQFLTSSQVDELREIVYDNIIVMCFGLKTDFMGHLFEGSKRLLEVADAIRETQAMCKCGRKAIINARYQENQIIYSGEQIDIGGNDKYTALCYQCWKNGNL